MSLIRTSALNGIAVAVRMGAALALNKILAIYTGPAGYALIGQFQNAVAMAITFGTGAVSTGVTKRTAELVGSPDRLVHTWRTAVAVVAGGSAVAGIGILLFHERLAQVFLHDARYGSVFIWLSVSLVAIAVNGLLLAILNGLKDTRRYVTSNIAGSLIGLLLIGVLSRVWGVYGALIALSLNQALVLAVTLEQIWRQPWFRRSNLIGAIDLRELRHLGGFVLMAATTAIVGPLSQILVRTHLGETFGWAYAGYWDAIWRISAIYLSFVTTTLSLYYLPRIAEIGSWPELRRELSSVYGIVLPAVVAAALTMYFARTLIVRLLFTASFAPMQDLFAFQMAGDVVKIASWLLAFIMVGRGMTKAFIATEIAGAAAFVGYTMLFTHLFGFRGVAMAHLATYTTYFLMVTVLTIGTPQRRDRLFVPSKNRA